MMEDDLACNSKPIGSERAEESPSPAVASPSHTPVPVELQLEDMMDDRGRPRSFSLVERWGTTEAEGHKVEFVRSLNGLSIEFRFKVAGRHHAYAVSIKPVLEACISAALSKATGHPLGELVSGGGSGLVGLSAEASAPSRGIHQPDREPAGGAG